MTDGLSPNSASRDVGDDCDLAEAKRRKAAGRTSSIWVRASPIFDAADSGRGGIRAIKDGKTHYSPNRRNSRAAGRGGDAIFAAFGRRPVQRDHIVVSNGSKQSLFNACSRSSARAMSSRFRRPPGCRIRRSCTWRARDR